MGKRFNMGSMLCLPMRRHDRAAEWIDTAFGCLRQINRVSTRAFHVLALEHLRALQAQVPDGLTNHSIRFAPNERKEPPTPKKPPIEEPKTVR